jgi:hemerythrin
MTLIEWSDELSCNVKEIDDQHKNLVAMLNELHRAMLRKEGQKALSSILGRMVEYTSYHFSTEERYMSMFHYPGLEAHRPEHAEFVSSVAQFQEEFALGKVGLSIEVMRYLSSWLTNHIMVSDKSFGPFFNAHGLCGYEIASS